MVAGMLLWGVVRAEGEPYRHAMQPSDWRVLQEFYKLYITDPAGRLNDAAAELRVLKQRTLDLRRMHVAGKSTTGNGCRPDCVVLGEIREQLARADDLLMEARKIIRGNLRILLQNQDIATKANSAYMDAQSKYELRKLGFDMSMIVAKAFELDPGPVFAQFLTNLDSDSAVTAIVSGTVSVGSDATRLAVDPKQLMSKKKAFITALTKYTAGVLFEGTSADSQFVSSFIQKMAAGVWETLHDIETRDTLSRLTESPDRKALFTSGMVSKIALKATLEAVADARGKALAEDVDMARKDSLRSESMRLLTIAEYKAMRSLMNAMHDRASTPASGVAVALNWERGRFAVVHTEWCGDKVTPPRFRRAPVGDQDEIVDVEPGLAAALSSLRRANDLLGRELGQLRKCERKREQQRQSDNTVSASSFGGSRGRLVGEIFYIKEGKYRLPDFEQLRPVGRIRTDRFDVSPREMRKGFPGVGNRYEWFALRYRGEFQVAREGEFRFRLLSDDGSKLLIDGQVVIDNDGGHPPRSREGVVRLSQGRHKLELQYFQGPRYFVALQLFVDCGGKWRIWDDTLLASEEGRSCGMAVSQ